MSTNIITLTIEAKGEIISSNFPAFAEQVREHLATFNRDLQTDDDFDQADKDAKAIAAAEADLKGAKEKALADAEQLNALFEQIDALTGDLSAARLDLTKQIAKRKEERKKEIAEAALATIDIEASLARKTFLGGMQAEIKGKRTVESMETACRIYAKTQQAKITKCREILASFEKAHGVEMILDRRELEVSNPDALEAELRRRFDAKKAADEKRRLEAEAAEAKAEADKLKAAAAAAKDPRNPHDLPPAPKIGSIPVGRPKAETLELRAEETEDEEWSRFMALFRGALAPVKDARAVLAHEINQQCALVIVKALGAGLKEVEAMREGVEA